MIVKRQEFLDVLETVRPALANPNEKRLEMGDHFVFTGNDVGTFCNHASILFPFETDFVGAIPAPELYELVKRLPDEFEIKADKDKVRILAKDDKGKIEPTIVLAPEDVTIVSMVNKVAEDAENSEFMDMESDFFEGLQYCLPSARKIEKDFNIRSSIFFHNDSMYASSDGKFAKYVMEKGFGEDVIFLSQSDYLNEIIRSGEEFIEIAISDTWIHFSTSNGILFSVRTWQMPEIPPMDYDGILDKVKKNNTIEITFPDGIADDLLLADIMRDENALGSKGIQVEVTKTKIILSSGKAKGNIIREISCKNKHSIKFPINPHYLIKALEINQKTVVSEGEVAGSLLFEGGKFTHVIATIEY